MSTKERVTITLDAKLLGRVDAIATAREDSRSAVLERIVRLGINEEEEFLGTLGSGVVGRVVEQLICHPEMYRMLSKLVGEKVTEADVQELRDMAGPHVRSAKRFRAGRSGR